MTSLSPPTSRARRTPAAASSSSVLPPDVLFDVLLQLPAKDLCRLRAVCRSWRFLTTDPLFVTAHAARHPGPLFLAKFRDHQTHHIHLVDLSGNVVKRIAAAGGGLQVMCTRLRLACLATDWNRCRVLNPATGAVCVLPENPAPEHVNRVNLRDPYTFFALGQVASTGEYKVLRMFNRVGFARGGEQLFEVFTINGGTDRARWRGRQSPGLFVEACSGVVVDGVVYFLMNILYDPMVGGAYSGIRPDYIVSFDLGREEWRRDLQGPIGSSLVVGNNDARKEYVFMWRRLTLAELKGSLALAYYRRHRFIMDIWFLTDFDNGLWVKEYSIRAESIVQGPADGYCVKPLLVLDDGRLVIYLAPIGLLFICDPGTNTFAEVDIKRLDSVGMYTGSLLTLQEGDLL